MFPRARDFQERHERLNIEIFVLPLRPLRNRYGRYTDRYSRYDPKNKKTLFFNVKHAQKHFNNVKDSSCFNNVKRNEKQLLTLRPWS